MKAKAAIFAVLAVLILASTAGAQTNLVVNGGFDGSYQVNRQPYYQDAYPRDRLPTGWKPMETFEGAGPEYSAYVVTAKAGGGKELRFNRTEYTVGLASGDYTGVYQDLVAPEAEECSSLLLRLDVKVNSHDLAAGGWESPAYEWPALVQLDYLTTAGQPQIWRHGWYLAAVGDGSRVVDPGTGLIAEFKDTAIPAGQYRTFEFDLLAELPQLDKLQKITVGGAGWSFDGAIDDVSITCQPAYAHFLHGRFDVSVLWRPPGTGPHGEKATAARHSDSVALFWYHTAEQPELLVRVLDTCGSDNAFRVEFAGLTDAEVLLRIEDRASGKEIALSREGQFLISDTSTFNTCDVPWP